MDQRSGLSEKCRMSIQEMKDYLALSAWKASSRSPGEGNAVRGRAGEELLSSIPGTGELRGLHRLEAAVL